MGFSCATLFRKQRKTLKKFPIKKKYFVNVGRKENKTHHHQHHHHELRKKEKKIVCIFIEWENSLENKFPTVQFSFHHQQLLYSFLPQFFPIIVLSLIAVALVLLGCEFSFIILWTLHTNKKQQQKLFKKFFFLLFFKLIIFNIKTTATEHFLLKDFNVLVMWVESGKSQKKQQQQQDKQGNIHNRKFPLRFLCCD